MTISTRYFKNSYRSKNHQDRTCQEISDYLDQQKSDGWPNSRSLSGRMYPKPKGQEFTSRI